MRQAALIFAAVFASIVLGGLLLIGAFVYTQHNFAPAVPGTVTTVDGVTLGRKFAPTLVGTFADGWLAAAAALEAGKSTSEAQAASLAASQAARSKAVNELVAPVLTKVLPEGTEPSDPEQRAAAVKLWRDFANGLRKGAGK